MVGLTLAALVAFGLVIQVGVATAAVLGLAAFNAGSLLDRLFGEIATIIASRERLQRVVARTDATTDARTARHDDPSRSL